MSEKNRENEDSDEIESTLESGIEVDGESCIIQVDSQNRSEDASEISQSEDEVVVTEIVTFKALPPDISGHERINPSSESSNVPYEYPDDSEFCESLESLSNLKKRPSDSIIESTSKKPCNEMKTVTNNQIPNTIEAKCEISGEKNKGINKTSEDEDKANNNNQVEGSQFLFGCKHKREGENKKSENVISAASQSSGRFTRHKGDNTCHHGNFEQRVQTCSSDDADVEDNAEDSIPISNKSRETPPKDTPAESSQNPFQNTIKDIVKRHIKTSSGSKKPSDSPRNTTITKLPHQVVANKKKIGSSKTLLRHGTTSNSGTTKHAKPANLAKIPESSSASKCETSSEGLKAKSQMTRQKKRRCRVCNKKLDLTAMHCRCGGLFCSKHRYDREHGCTFDYRAMGAEEIRKNNPKIVAEKVRKI